MFLKFCTRSFNKAVVLLAVVLLGSTSAYAVIEIKELVIRVGAQDSPLPLALDIVVEHDSGRLKGAIMGLNKFANVTLKRGIVRALPDGVIETTHAAQFSHQTDDGAEMRSDVSVQLQSTSDRNGSGIELRWDKVGSGIAGATARYHVDPEWKYVPVRRLTHTSGDDDIGDMILFAAIPIDSQEDHSRSIQREHCCPAEDLSLNFEEIKLGYNSEQSWGEPVELFNNSGPGEDLIATIPMPLPGEVFVEELRLYSSERSEPQIIHVQLSVVY